MRGRGQNSGQAPLQREPKETSTNPYISDSILHQRKLTAKKLGLPIYATNIAMNDEGESTGSYNLDLKEEDAFMSLRNHIDSGNRGVIIMGADGSGKSEIIREVAALRSAAYLQIPTGEGAPFTIEVNDENATILVPDGDVKALETALQGDCVVELEDLDNPGFQRLLAEGLQDKTLRVNGKDLKINDEVLVASTFKPEERDERLLPENQENYMVLDFGTPAKAIDSDVQDFLKTRKIMSDAGSAQVEQKDTTDLQKECESLFKKFEEGSKESGESNDIFPEDFQISEADLQALKTTQSRFAIAKENGAPVEIPTDKMMARVLLESAAGGYMGDNFAADRGMMVLRGCLPNSLDLDTKDGLINSLTYENKVTLAKNTVKTVYAHRMQS